MTVLRDMGLPTLVPVCVPPVNATLKVRAASKKLATEALKLQVISSLPLPSPNPIHATLPYLNIDTGRLLTEELKTRCQALHSRVISAMLSCV